MPYRTRTGKPPWTPDTWLDYNHYDHRHYHPEHLFLVWETLWDMMGPARLLDDYNMPHMAYFSQAILWETEKIEQMLVKLGYYIMRDSNNKNVLRPIAELRSKPGGV